MFCKNCGKEVEDKQKFCQYCGNNLQESFWKAPAVVEEKKEVEVVIHGYTQWFAIRPMVVVEYGSQEIGRVGYNEVKIFNLPSKGTLTFRCMGKVYAIRMQKNDFHVYLKWNRFTGEFIVE